MAELALTSLATAAAPTAASLGGSLALAAPAASAVSTLGTLGTVASIGGTLLTAAGQARSGASNQAAQMQQQAGQERAAAQRQAMEERRRARLAESRALAVAGASGAGASDPTVLDIMGGIAEEGEYRALNALYTGEDRARGMEGNAAARRFEADQARRAGRAEARSTLLGGGYSLLQRFG